MRTEGERQTKAFASRLLRADEARHHLGGLARILEECVEGGASVSFMPPFTLEAAGQFFQGVIRDVEAGRLLLLGAFREEKLVGTVQVVLAMPPNQPHRAEIAKLLVSPEARGLGIGAMLMKAAEEQARGVGKSLLVLDTCTGSTAEALYLRLGWTKAGVIPGYALFPDGSWCDTSIFWKRLFPATISE